MTGEARKNLGKGKVTDENLIKWLKVSRMVFAGHTLRDTGESVGVSVERARQMVFRIKSISLKPFALDEPYPEHDKDDIKQVREHADFWLRRVDALERLWCVDASDDDDGLRLS